MTTLSRIQKSPVSFTKLLTPDKKVPTIKAAQSDGLELTRSQRPVEGSFTWVAPERRKEYKLRWVSPAALESLGLDSAEAQTDLFEKTFSGQTVFTDEATGLYPYAQNYAGYQFGHWAGQLGDGRAISLFQLTNSATNRTYEIQLKGAGLTPYSRFADGKAVVRSSIREALASEAVHALGIPTTRALSLVELPGTYARRERMETSAIVARMAESWVRIGTFDLHHSRDDRAELRKLADYCVSEVYKGAPEKAAAPGENRYYQLFREVCVRNAKMIGLCQAYGLMNGVLNTDNTSILGLSMDYGPFAFMDKFDFNFTPNHDDHDRRYGYQNSPTMIWWNCVRLGESLGELIGQGDSVDDEAFSNGTPEEDRKHVIDRATKLIMGMGEDFAGVYKETWMGKMRERLGLLTVEEDDEKDLVHPLLKVMHDAELDYNDFFRRLGRMEFFTGKLHDPAVFLPKERGITAKIGAEEAKSSIDGWLALYIARLEKELNDNDKERRQRMERVNPNFILKNWVLQEIIAKAEEGDWEPFYGVSEMALDPFNEKWSTGKWAQYVDEVPTDARGFTCSCSS